MRKIIYIFISLGWLLSCQKQADWTLFRGEQGSGRTINAIYPPLGILWNLNLQKDEKAQTFNPPMVKGNTIYFGSGDGNFYALDVDSGYMKWIFSTKGAVNSVPFVGKDRVYVGSNDGRVYALDIDTGEKIWDFYTGNTVQSLILEYKDNVIFTSDTGFTFFLNREGQKVYSIPNPSWSHHTFQIYDDIIYWAPNGRNFGAYDLKDKKFLWMVRVTVPYPVWYSFPAIDEKNVYYGSSYLTPNGSILNYYALNRLTGEVIWEKEEVMDIGDYVPYNQNTLFLDHAKLLDYMAPALWKNYVIFTNGGTTVRAFNKDTGEDAWTRTFDYPASSAPTVAGDRLYFGLRDGKAGIFSMSDEQPSQLVCISASNGETQWKMPVDGPILSAPVISGKRIFFGTGKNRFYVLEEVF